MLFANPAGIVAFLALPHHQPRHEWVTNSPAVDTAVAVTRYSSWTQNTNDEVFYLAYEIGARTSIELDWLVTFCKELLRFLVNA